MCNKSNAEILKQAARGEFDAIVWWFNNFVFNNKAKPFDVYESFQQRFRNARSNNTMLAIVMAVVGGLNLPLANPAHPLVAKIMWCVGWGFIISAGVVLFVGARQRTTLCGNKKHMEKVRKNALSIEDRTSAMLFEWEVAFIPVCRAVLDAFDLDNRSQEMKDPFAFQKLIYHDLSFEYLIEHVCRECNQMGGPSGIYSDNHERLITKAAVTRSLGIKVADFSVFLNMPKPEGWFREPIKVSKDILAILETSEVKNPG